MTNAYDIELLHPKATLGVGAEVEPLGVCRIVTKNVFVTVSEHSGEARLVLLDEIEKLDRTLPCYTTVLGTTHHPRRVDLPERIVVEMSSGHARTLDGDKIVRLKLLNRGRSLGVRSRVSW